MSEPCFVDANVFIYARDQGDPLKQKRANEWLFHLWREQLGRTSVQGQFDLYKMNPDGSALELLYGANSHQTGSVDPRSGNPTTIQFLAPHPLPDGRTLAILRPFISTNEGGEPVMIDTGWLFRSKPTFTVSSG